MRKALHYTAYILAYGFWYAASLLPLWAHYLISDFLAFLLIYIIRYRHRVIWQNLKTSFPEKTDKELRTLRNAFYRHFCDYLVETIKLMTMSQAQLRKRMTFTGVEQMKKVADEGQSVAILLGHYGNWEWITSLPHWLPEGLVCCQLYHPLANEYFDKLFKFVRERQGSHCVPKKDALRWMVKCQQEGKVVVCGYIADQSPKWNSIHHWVDFLRHDTPVFTGSEKLACHFNQAVFYGDMSRVSRGHYNCEFHLLTRSPKEQPEFHVTDVYFRELEKTIRRAPAYYLWSHNRWKRTHEEFNAHFKYVNGKVVHK